MTPWPHHQTSHWFGVHCHTTATSCYLRREKVVVDAAFERNQGHVEVERMLAVDTMMSGERQRRLIALGKKQGAFLCLKWAEMGLTNFRTVIIAAESTFGEVRVVQNVGTGGIYTTDTSKEDILKKDQLAHVHTARGVLAESNSPWVVQLYYSFQHPMYLYLIMDFPAGGDSLITLIMRGTSEDVTGYCVVEDIKPDVILIDKGGHVKLSDFGLSTGFHKQHDSSCYQHLSDSANGVASPTTAAQWARDSAIVNAHLTMSSKDQTATRRANRGKLACSAVTAGYVAAHRRSGALFLPGFSFLPHAM